MRRVLCAGLLVFIFASMAPSQFITQRWELDYPVLDVIDVDNNGLAELVTMRNDTTFFYHSRNYSLLWMLPGKRLFPSDVNITSALVRNPRIHYPYRDYNRDGHTDVLMWDHSSFSIIDVINNATIFKHTEKPGTQMIPFLVNLGSKSKLTLIINTISGDTLYKTYIYDTDIPQPAGSSLVGGIPPYFKLYQNYPNPFNQSTMIRYSIGEKGHVNLNIYNVHGELIDVLVDAEQASGMYTYPWDASEFSAGTYFYQIELDGQPLGGKKAIYLK
ncbi:MAG: hypothetical protein MAGBODY4_00050 [Candidatus Marinimicrobia bacterium]|nr:hypothetical protein [Candidatus Neomarinimicrobiota bacterium]